jgi:tRNA-2-methylthio-N6-dimethylallyladenosine synthase
MALETYKIVTFGCQMNAYDSEVMAGILEARGWKPVEAEEDADVLLFNTCIVRASAEQRALGRIDGLKALKKAKPERILGVCGCLAQREAAGLLQRAPHLDLVLGTRAIPNLSALLDHLLAGGEPVACTDEYDEPYQAAGAAVRRSELRALVTIMQGCNNWCSYCIVPAVRGREKSRPLGTIVDEITELVRCGCREITLVGQNVNAWRGDLDGQDGWKTHAPRSESADGHTLDFADLLGRVQEIEGLLRIRYITSHPRDAGQRQIEAVARNGKVCEHFHLPAQSGSNRVLELMNRGYTREKYLDLVRAIRAEIPDATFTTDLIVGFPGESDDDYRQTLDLVREVGFDSAFTFFYNPREGTRAATWDDDVSVDVKKERLAELITLQEQISAEKNRALVGRTLEVLVEGPARRTSDHPIAGLARLMGRTRGDKCVVFDGDLRDQGHLVQVQITEGASHTLLGKKCG